MDYKSYLARELPQQLKRDILMDEVCDGVRYVIRRDSHNWIWMEGSPKMDDDSFFKQSRHNKYYTSFDSLLRCVFKELVNDGIPHLDEKSILVAHAKALSTMEEIAERLDKVSWGALDRGDYCPKCHSKKVKGD